MRCRHTGSLSRHLYRGGRHPQWQQTPLFRSAAGRTDTLTEKPMHRVDAWRMIQCRAADLGTRVRIGCHTFRATGITAYLEAGGTLIIARATNSRSMKPSSRPGDELIGVFRVGGFCLCQTRGVSRSGLIEEIYGLS